MQRIDKDKLIKKMQLKLNKNTQWSYIPTYFPKDMSEIKLIEGMNNFIQNHLDKALEQAATVLSLFSWDDCASIGKGELTENALKLSALIDYLDANGFPGPASFAKPVNFYSGKIAQKRAYHTSNELSLIEGMIPCFTLIYDLWYAVSAKPDASLIFCSLSKTLATYAHHTVNVYLSSDQVEKPAGLTAGSYFWDMELPVILQRCEIKGDKRVTDIQLHIFNQNKNSWEPPVSWFSENIADTLIYIKEHSNRYKSNETVSTKDVYSKPITLGYLKNALTLWQNKAGIPSKNHKQPESMQLEEIQPVKNSLSS